MRSLPSRAPALVLGFALLAGLMACEEDDPSRPSVSCQEEAASEADDPSIQLRFVHRAGATPLAAGVLEHENQAGNPYSVDKLEYLLTDVTLVETTAKAALPFCTPVHVDAFDAGTHDVTLGQVPPGTYDQLRIRWGVEASNNESGNLSSEFDGMLWPAMNGGGYHCMRFEGDYTTTGSQVPGDASFALHMGKLDRFDQVTDGAVLLTLDDLQFTAESGGVYRIEIVVDVDAFMDDPLYDLEAPGDVDNGNGGFFPLAFPTMPSHLAQGLMRDNMGNVFSVGSIQQINLD